VNPSDIAQETLDTGRRALGGIAAGAAWVTWGLSVTHGVARPVTITLILTASLLLICCGHCIWKGRSLQEKYPSPPRPLNRGFLVVTLLEAAGVFGVVIAAQKTARLDALPDWIGLVIGLHFFGLAKVFRAPVYYVTGVSITLWCLISWLLFRGNALAVSVGCGICAILWATSSFNLLRVLVLNCITTFLY
jgi:hypothetical protein